MLKSFKSFISGRNHFQYLLLALVLGYFLFFVLYRLGDVFMFSYDDIDKGVFSRCLIYRFFCPSLKCVEWRTLLMMYPYVGQLQQYLGAICLVLFEGIWGPVFAIKFPVVILGVVSLVCIFLVLRHFFDPWMALLTVFFMGTNSVYIQSVRYGLAREEVLQIAGLWLGLYLLVRGYSSRKQGWVYGGIFVFGLTLWAKIMFLGYVIGAFCGMFVLGKHYINSLRRFLFPSWSVTLLRAGVFCLGIFPLVLYNLTGAPGETASFMFGSYFQKGILGSLTWLVGIFRIRIYDSFRYCLGTLYSWDYGSGWFGAILIFCAAIWCFGLGFVRVRRNRRRRFIAFVVVAYTVLFMLSNLIVIGYNPGHLIILVPFTEMLCAIFVVDICGRIKSRKAVVALAVVVIAGWLEFHVRYETTRILNRNSPRGYLPSDFLVSDMTAIISRVRELNVRHLYCGRFLSDTVRFFLRHDMTVICRSVDSTDYYDGAGPNEPWYLLTTHSSLVDEDAEALRRMWGAGAALETVEVFDIPLSCCSKMYLHRIKKA